MMQAVLLWLVFLIAFLSFRHRMSIAGRNVLRNTTAMMIVREEVINLIMMTTMSMVLLSLACVCGCVCVLSALE